MFAKFQVQDPQILSVCFQQINNPSNLIFELSTCYFTIFEFRMIHKPRTEQKIEDNNIFSLCDKFLENARKLKNVDNKWNAHTCQSLRE